MNKFTFNNRNQLTFRRKLRKRQTTAEYILWSQILNRKIGFKFRRQYSVGPFILDFYCPEKRFCIELDGTQHLNNIQYDNERSEYLNSFNIIVYRVSNIEVFDDIDKVIQRIVVCLDSIIVG
jgi:very-short-patch-repair endonuclease